MSWWWLSYVGDEGNRGVVIVEAEDFVGAIDSSRSMGLSPGGQVQGVEFLADDPEEMAELEQLGANRLIPTMELFERGYFTIAQAEEVMGEVTNEQGETLAEYIDRTAETVCESCEADEQD